jgi:hypothetical protein
MVPLLESKELTIDWLIENKKSVLAAKKSAVKYADAIITAPAIFPIDQRSTTNKGLLNNGPEDIEDVEITELKAQLIINTTNVMDSHNDVHIPGLWKKSLLENNIFYLCQEHEFSFSGIISDNIIASTKKIAWNKINAPFEGNTEALIYDAIISKKRNPFMFDQYLNKYVRNHSVGMMYVKINMCVDDERYTEEKGNWDKYYKEVANKDEADSLGYFFAVTEAKIIEGSAVTRGSNRYTPTQSIEENKNEPEQSTLIIEPEQSTQKVTNIINPNLF